jgi:predicted Zn-dependent peptidase
MFKKTTLKNGLRIITVPNKGTKAVTCLVLVGTGSKYEEKKINGISHLLEHLFFKGTKNRPTTMKIAEPLDAVGGAYNAFTGEDYTGYFAKVDERHFDLALDIISDIYLNSKLDDKEVQKEKGVVIEEINMYKDNPMAHVQSLWTKLLYGDQPAGRDIAGTKESVMGITRNQLAEYMKTQYNSKNTVVCIAGAVPEKAIDKVKRHFSHIPTNKGIKKPKVVERQKKPEMIVEYRGTDQTHFCLGVRAFNIFDPRRWSAELLGLILGGMMSSRLFSSVREKLSLCYYIRTSASLDPDAGFLMTQAGVDNLRVEKAVEAVLKEYSKIAETKVSAKELKKVKDHIKGKMILTFENSDALASFYGAQELLEKKILTPEQIYDKINKITVNDILKVSKDIFKRENLNLALIGPVKSKDKLWKILRKF